MSLTLIFETLFKFCHLTVIESDFNSEIELLFFVADIKLIAVIEAIKNALNKSDIFNLSSFLG
jgi:hypothetical protein